MNEEVTARIDLQKALRPPCVVARSLLGSMELFSLPADTWEYELRLYQALPDTARMLLRSMLHGPIEIETDPHKRSGPFCDVDPVECQAFLTELHRHGVLNCDSDGTTFSYSLAARGLRLLQMEKGGDVFGEVRAHELNQFLEQADTVARIAALARRFKTYFTDDMTVGRIRQFLEQVEVVSEVLMMLKILEEVRFYSKLEVTRLLSEYLKLATDDLQRPFSIVLFGNLADSSAEMTQTVLKELLSDKQSSDVSLQLENAVDVGRDIVFIDDNVGSATQSVQLLSEYLGLLRGQEEHVRPLSSSKIEALRKCKISLVCCHCTRKGMDALRRFADAQGLQLDVFGDVVIQPNIFSDSYVPHIWSNPSHRLYWEDRFQQLGERLLADYHLNPEKRKRDALGWKGGRGLSVYAHNTPTTTLTFLWKEYDGVDGRWQPLFPRRDHRAGPVVAAPVK